MLFEAFIGFVLVLVALYILFYVDAAKHRKSVPTDFPPGPITLPFMENFYFSSSTLLKTVEKLRKKFGDIIGLQFGKKNVVIISDYELIQEAYNMPALCGKHLSEVDVMISQRNNLGTAVFQRQNTAEGNQERKFILKTLRDFGFGPRTIESIMHEDVNQLVNTLKSVTGQVMNPTRGLQLAVFNYLLRFITSETFSQKDVKLQKLWEQFETVMSTENIQIPTLMTRFLPPQLSGKKKLENAVVFVEDFLKEKILEHNLTLGGIGMEEDDTGINKDFIDAYLQEIINTKDIKSSFYGEVGELNLLISCLNLIGGSRKTCTSIIWALYHISHDQAIQKKLHEEIDRHIGIYRLPGIKDKLTMPFTEALMLETFRLSSVTPFGNPHNSTSEVSFHGYKIPEDTLILMNLHDVHHDTKHWDDPETFRPERFLTPNEKEVVKAHRPVIWSSIGKRTSPNELLESDNFFIFITSIFQRFNISTGDSKQPLLGNDLFYATPNFKVIFEDRLEFLDRNEHRD